MPIGNVIRLKVNFVNGSRERNEVKRPDIPRVIPVTSLRCVPGCHWMTHHFLE